MMLNDIIAISNASNKLSGTGRLQALKDGTIAGLGLFTDDPEAQQKIFLSVLSQLGTGTNTAEESKNANLKITEGRLTDDVTADNAVAGKPKVKQVKDGGVVKRLPSVYPEALGLVMELQSLPEMPQSDLSEDTVFNTLSAENEQEIVSGLPIGKLLPETVANPGLPGERNAKSGKLSMPTVLEDSNQDSVSQVQTVPKAEVAGKPDVKKAPEPYLSGRGRVQAVPVEGTSKLHRHQRKALLNQDTVNLNPLAGKIKTGVKGDQTQRFSSGQSKDAAVREKMPTDQTNDPDIRSQAVKVKSASFYPANDAVETGEIAATSAGTSNADDSETSNMTMAANHSRKIAGGEDGVNFQSMEPESGELAVNLARESQMEKTSWVNPSAKESRPDGQSFHAEVLKQVMDKTSTSLKSGQSEIRIDLKPESLGHLRLHVLTDHQQVTAKILAENPLVKEMIENQASLIKNELQHQGIHVNKVKVEMLMSGGSDFAHTRHEGAAFETGEITATSAGTSNADDSETSNMTMAANHSRKIAGGEDGVNFQSMELESGELAVNLARESQMEKTSWVDPSAKESRPDGQSFHAEVLKQVMDKTSTSLKSGQSEIRIDLKPESLGHLRLHVLTDHQQVTVKILAENPLVKEMIENQASLIKNELQQQGIHVNTVKVEMLMSGGSDFAHTRHEGAAFETGEITATSAGTLNADDNETAYTFMAASHTGKIAGGEDGVNFQSMELESGELAVNLARESQMEKTSWVNPSAKESRPDGQSFHAEVLKQVMDKTSTSLKSGQSEIRIDLKPESLGHLRLHVLTDHQQVTVKILAENPLVKEMIENQASLIKNELQQQGIHVNTVKVEMLMSGGSDFAYSQHEGNAFKQPRYDPAYGRGKDNTGDNASKEKDPLDQANNRGGSLVNYFA